MVAVKVGLIGPQADGSTPFHNPLDVRRHQFWQQIGGKAGILKGFVPSVVAGQMQLSFTAGSAGVCERDGSQVELDRAYPVYADTTSIVQFGAASPSNRNDAVVAAAVDVEDGAQGTGAIGVGGHLVVIPGVSGTTTPRTDAQIAAYLGRGGWHRLYDVPIASGSTQINLAGATFTGFKINDWNNFSDIPMTLTAGSGWSLTSAAYKLWSLQKRVAIDIVLSRTGADGADSDSAGNITDVSLITNWPALLLPAADRWIFMSRGPNVGTYQGKIEVSSNDLVITNLITPSTHYPTGTTIVVYGTYDL